MHKSPDVVHVSQGLAHFVSSIATDAEASCLAKAMRPYRVTAAALSTDDLLNPIQSHETLIVVGGNQDEKQHERRPGRHSDDVLLVSGSRNRSDGHRGSGCAHQIELA
jgi:hypothetical protein